MRAVSDIQRLRIYPVVFSVNAVMSAALGDFYGRPCVQVMSEAASLLDDVAEQAGSAGSALLSCR